MSTTNPAYLSDDDRAQWQTDVDDCAECQALDGEEVCGAHDLDDEQVALRYSGAGSRPAAPAAEAKTRTITLTDRPPVKIREDEWPEIAVGRAGVTMRNGTPLPDYERAVWMLRVRQHADGRALVYGVAEAPGTGWPTHGASDWRGGELVPAAADLVAVIQRVGRHLVELGGAPESVVRECIAALPAEEI